MQLQATNRQTRYRDADPLGWTDDSDRLRIPLQVLSAPSVRCDLFPRDRYDVELQRLNPHAEHPLNICRRDRRGRPLLRLLAVLVALALPVATAAAPVMPRDYLDRDGSPLPFETEEEILDFLRTAEVIGVKELSSGSTRPLRLDLERDGIRARAVFRTVDRRRERQRTHDGRAYAVFYDRAVHEVAAYRLARLLGLDMVPPTVIREYEGHLGSLQLWVERARTAKQRQDSGDLAPEPIRWMHQRAVMEVFDALVGNADRNTGNSLVDERWRLWMIDHTRAFQRPRDPDDLSWINHVPDQLLERIRTLSESAVIEALSPYLEPKQIDGVLGRRQAIVRHVASLVQTLGYGAVILTGKLLPAP